MAATSFDQSTWYQTYSGVADDAAAANGIPASLFKWQIGQESSWNPNAQNGSATGIAQFIPTTAAAFSINPLDPVASIKAAAAYDAQLFSSTGSFGQMLSAYGTVNSSSPQSVIDAANAQLTAVGAAPISTSGSSGTGAASTSGAGATTGTASTIGAIQSLPGAAVASGLKSAVTGIFTPDVVVRIVYVVLGFVLIGAGLYLLKPVQQVVNTAASKGVGVAAKGLAAAAI